MRARTESLNEWGCEGPEMNAVTKAIDRVLLQHEPHSALVLDRYWNVIRTNEAAPRFFGSFVDLEARQRRRCYREAPECVREPNRTPLN